jgi:hypothetical protein
MVVVCLYCAAGLGVLAAILSLTLDAQRGLRFVLALLAVILAILCAAVGTLVDSQRSVGRP